MESIGSFNQSFRRTKNLISFSLLALLLGCESTPKKVKENPLAPPSFQLPNLVWNIPEVSKRTSDLTAIATSEFEPLVKTGNSIHPQIDAKGTLLVYSSGKRQRHDQYEVYSLDLLTSKERRITFQKKDAIASALHPHREHVLYSTGNEELIRNPDKIFAKLKKKAAQEKPSEPGLHLLYPPTDIFSQDLGNLSREELTRTNGADLWPSYSANGRRVVFSSNRKGQANIYSMNLKGRQFRSVVISPAQDIHIRLSPNQKKMVWIRRSNAQPGSQLITADANGRNRKNFDLPEGDHIFPTWHSSGDWILFSSDLADGKNFSLFAVHSSGGCLTRLTSDDVHALFPVSHPTEDRIYYSKLDYGQWVIGSQRIPLPKTCVMNKP